MTHIFMASLVAFLVAVPCSLPALVHMRLVEELRLMNDPRPGDATLVLRIDAKSDYGPTAIASMQGALLMSTSFAGRVRILDRQHLLFDMQDYTQTCMFDTTRMSLLWIYTYNGGILRSVDTSYLPILRIVIEFSMVQLAGCLEWSDGIPQWYTTDTAMTVLTGAREAIPPGLRNMPLPVELESITAVCDRDRIRLRWSTVTEANNAGFVVQRSEEYPHTLWQVRGYVPGHGSSSTPRRYDFSDAVSTDMERLWYRLIQVDRDGTESISPAVLVEHNPADAALTYPPYPNPFERSFTVAFQTYGKDDAFVELHDAAGRLVMTRRLHCMKDGLNRFMLQVPDVPSGMYMYKFRCGSVSRSGWMMKR